MSNDYYGSNLTDEQRAEMIAIHETYVKALRYKLSLQFKPDDNGEFVDGNFVFFELRPVRIKPEPAVCYRNGRPHPLVGPVICWWFGCQPDYDHPCELSPNYVVPCKRCGARDTTYADRIGDTRHAALVALLRYWLWRRWIPTRCGDCGKRFGGHDQCLPF